MSKYESLEAAKNAQELKAQQVKDAKAALATYFKENKLKKMKIKAEDYLCEIFIQKSKSI